MKILKKVLVMAKSLGGGGSEVALVEFLNSLDLSKFSVTLLLLKEDNEYKYRLNQKIKIQYLKFDNPFYKNLVSLYTIPSKAIKKLRLNSLFNIYQLVINHSIRLDDIYDVALDFYGYGSFTTEYISKVIRANYKATWLHDEKMNWIYNVERSLGNYNAFFCVSKSVKKRFDKNFPSLKSRTKVFYNVIDDQKIIYNSTKQIKLPFKKNKISLLTVGRLTEQKGIDIAIKAASQLKKHKIPFEWFVIGEGRDHRKLNKLIKQENVEDCFFLLGRKDNPYPYMKNCELYVQPSRHEGFGLTLYEARLLKKTVIATKLPAFKEQIIDRKNGLLVKKNNYQDLAQKIEYLLGNQPLWQEIKNYIDKENLKYNNNLINSLFD